MRGPRAQADRKLYAAAVQDILRDYETLKIVAPFEEGSLAIPVSARVVRLDRPADSSLAAVAVELKRGDVTHPV